MNRKLIHTTCKQFYTCLICLLLAFTESYGQESIRSLEDSYNQRIANIEKRLADLRSKYEQFKQEMRHFDYVSEEKKNEAAKTDYYYRSSINNLENELNATRQQKEEAIEAQRKTDKMEKMLKQRAINARRQKEQQMQIEAQKKKQIERAKRQAIIEEQRKQQKELIEAQKEARNKAKEIYREEYLNSKNKDSQIWHKNIDYQKDRMEITNIIDLNNHKNEYGLQNAKTVSANEPDIPRKKGKIKEAWKAAGFKEVLRDSTEIPRSQVNDKDYY